jgi:hypothetical protein
MCLKTVWIDLVRPWGPKSVQMQSALAMENTMRKNPDAEPEAIDLDPMPPENTDGDAPTSEGGNSEATGNTQEKTVASGPTQTNGNSSTPALTPQQHLEHFVTKDCGFTFERWRAYAGKSGVKDADSLGSFAEVPTEIAARHLRGKMNLKEELAKI